MNLVQLTRSPTNLSIGMENESKKMYHLFLKLEKINYLSECYPYQFLWQNLWNRQTTNFTKRYTCTHICIRQNSLNTDRPGFKVSRPGCYQDVIWMPVKTETKITINLQKLTQMQYFNINNIRSYLKRAINAEEYYGVRWFWTPGDICVS